MHTSTHQHINIAFHSTQFSMTEWQGAFDAVASNIQLHNIHPNNSSGGDISRIEVLLLWKPSVTDWRSATRLQHVIYLGASIGSAEQHLQLPDDVTVHRLHDAGMKIAMCDYAEYAVLHYQRRFDIFAQAQKQQQWINDRDYKQRDDINVCVLGLGILGGAIATHLQQVGYCVSGWSRSFKNIDNIDTYYGDDAFNDAIDKCDIVINMLPHTQDTYHFLNHQRLSLLPQGAALISLSRGAIIDTSALVALLNNEHLRGAFLDVFEAEPLSNENPLWHHPKVTITPHQSAPTQITEAAKEIILLLNKTSTVIG